MAAADKQTMIRLVQKHRIVGCRFFDRPRFRIRSFGAINHGNLTRARHIYKNARTAGFQTERLWMPGQFDVGNFCAGFCINGRERAAALTDIDFLGGFIVTNIVGIIAQLY